MRDYFVILSNGRRNPSTLTVSACDAFEAAFFAWTRNGGSDRPTVRYDSRTDRYFISNGNITESAVVSYQEPK